MPHSMTWAKRLLREALQAGDPEALLDRESYADPGVVDLFQDHLDESIYHDPQAALRWARVAPDLALSVKEEPGPEGRQAHRSRLTRSWAVLGSALRASGQNVEAEDAYREALALIATEPIEPATAADVRKRLAVLRVCQGRTDEALELSSEALATLRKMPEPEPGLLYAAIASHGYILGQVDRFPEAIAHLGEVLRKVNVKHSPRCARAHENALHNLAGVMELSRLEDRDATLRVIRRAKRKLHGVKRSSARHRLQWIEARTWAAIGFDRRAEQAFRVALSGFERLRLPWESALCALDLGELHRAAGEWEELRELAGETYQRFAALSGSTEALVALSQWRSAVEAKNLTAAITGKARGVILERVRGGCCR